MSQQGTPLRLDRRRVLASAVAAAVAGLAGCGDDVPGRSDAKDPLAYVSASASVVVDVDNAVADDDATRQLVEAYESEEGENYLQTFEERTGFPPEEAERTLLYANESNDDDEQGTLIVEAPWDEQEAVDALKQARDAEYEETDHDAGTIHEPQADDEIALGVAAEGQFVYGTSAEVKTCLDVFDGSGDGLGDPLRSAFEDAREAEPASTEGASQGLDGGGTPTDGDTEADGGTDTADGNGTETDGGGGEGGDTEFTKYVAAATDDPRAYLPEEDSDRVPGGVSLSLYDSLQTATATYFAAEQEVAVDVVLRADDEEVAREVADFTATALTFLRSDVDDEAVKDELAQMGVKRDGTDVLVVYRSDAEGAATLITWI